ncbi:hypothetical protein [Mucilaginibacter sp.]|uniref:hypothetical protein n=1 Tax=Mucilaginibacter sp. TaxID=1882438 RepID=UPI003265C321
MKTSILFTICLCWATYSFGQTPGAESTASPFFSNLQIRKSFEAADVLQKPVQLLYTAPHDGKNSWLADAGIGITLGKLSTGTFTSKLTAEYHRNTLIDAEQNNFQAGYNFNIFGGNGDGVNSFYTTAITGTTKYVRDKIKDDHSFVATLNLTPYLSGAQSAAGQYGFNLGRPGYTKGLKNTYQVGPAFEVQYQQILSSASGIKGGIIRPLVDLFAAISINQVPVAGAPIVAPKKIIEFSFDYINRYAVANSTGNSEGFTKLFKGGVDYYIAFREGGPQASLGLSYNVGSDPLEGLKNQRFWEFTLQFKL